MKTRTFQPLNVTGASRTVFACIYAVITATAPAAEPGPSGPQALTPSVSPKETADWYKNEECRMVFFTVLEGLYRDGISQEVVDLVIGRVEANSIDRAFIFRCKLCHACYEAFAVYQRRPDFHGTGGVSTIGKREIPKEIIETLRTGGRREFDMAFGWIVQPWITEKLDALIESGADETDLLAKYVELAREGNALITGYSRCQACDAIGAVAKKMAEEE